MEQEFSNMNEGNSCNAPFYYLVNQLTNCNIWMDPGCIVIKLFLAILVLQQCPRDVSIRVMLQILQLESNLQNIQPFYRYKNTFRIVEFSFRLGTFFSHSLSEKSLEKLPIQVRKQFTFTFLSQIVQKILLRNCRYLTSLQLLSN